MIVQAQKLPLLKHPETRLQLYPHQAVMLDEWDRHKTFLLVTKTGIGKTIEAAFVQAQAAGDPRIPDQ